VYGRLRILKELAWSVFVDPVAFIVDRLRRQTPSADLVPLSQINPLEPAAGRWESTGNDPQFLVAGRPPRGWSLLRVCLQCDSQPGATAQLYFDRGSGYSEADSIAVPANGQPAARWIFLDGVEHLRFDPCSQPGGFRIDEFRIQRSLALWVKSKQWIAKRTRKPGSSPRGREHSVPSRYQAWLEVNQWNSRRRQVLQTRLESMKTRPVISVLMPLYNPPLEYLMKAVTAVRDQVYPHWELCLVDDGSPNSALPQRLLELSREDSRIKIHRREQNGGISRATNDAANLASGDYLAFVDQDDEITPDALGEVALYLSEHPDTDYLYSDDDKIDEHGRRFDPQFKPDWSPELLLSYMYMSHLIVVRRDLFGAVGGCRVGFEGSQDYDLALRATERARRVGHIPKVLYHWRVLPGSTALSGSEKPASYEAGRRGVEDALNRRNVIARATHPDWAARARCGIFSHEFTDDGPPIAILIPATNGIRKLKPCLEALTRTSYRNVEVIILADPEDETGIPVDLGSIPHQIVQVRDHDCGSSDVATHNLGVHKTKADFVLFLSPNAEVTTPHWLSQMAGYLSLDGVGAVGARLIDANGTIRHAGIVHSRSGRVVTAFGHYQSPDFGYLAYARVSRNYSACSAACLLMPRDLFISMHGFDTATLGSTYSVFDLGFRLLDRGLRIVYCPTAELVWREEDCSTGPKDVKHESTFKQRYRSRSDPYYNPNLSPDGSFSIAPRTYLSHPVSGPIKTLMVSHNLGLEGAPNSQLELAVGLTQRGVIDPIVVSPTDGPLRAAYETAGIGVRIEPLLNATPAHVSSYWSWIEELRAWIESTKAEVVYANTRLTFPVIHAARKANIPSLWNLRESEPLAHYFDDLGESVAAEALRCLHYPYQNVYVSRATMESCRQFDTHHNSMTIHNGLDRVRFTADLQRFPRPIAREQLGIAPNDIAVLLLGTVCDRKGQLDLIEAAAALPDDIFNRVRFFIVGDRPGPYSERLRKRTQELFSLRKIQLAIVPETSEAALYYSAADMFVCSSRIESFPRVILEAMAAGLPIVTTPVFGIAEQVVADFNGLFYVPGDIVTLAHHLKRFIEDPALRVQMGRNSLAVLDGLTDYDSMLEQYAEIIREAWMSGCARQPATSSV